MKTYLIQRNVKGAGALTPAQLQSIAQKSCPVIDELGEDHIQWIHSYLTADAIWCIYKAENEEFIREHGCRGGFPVDNLLEIHGMFSPATATANV